MQHTSYRRIVLALSAALCLTGCFGGDNTFVAPDFMTGAGMPAKQPATGGFTPVSMVVPALMTPGGDDKDMKDVYAALYPYYAELCALSEIDKKPGFGAEYTSGFGGHSVLYLNGVCRDHDINYPVIKLCDGPDAASQGVGLSVNDHYRNANWIAVEGKDFLFYGSLKPGDHLTKDSYYQTQAIAKKMGVLNGIEFHRHFFDTKPAGMSQRDYMYELSVATDYAINFGRDRYCARVPLNRDQMRRMVVYLNQLNEPYRTGKKKFQWGVLTNNCSHMAHNALAAAGIWTEDAIEEPLFIAAFTFPVPKNEFVNLMQRTNDMPIDNLLTLYGDDVARQSLMADGKLPTHAGALLEAAPVLAQNDLYETRLRLIFYDPIGKYQRSFEDMMGDPRYVDLRSNLSYFAGIYQHLKETQKPLSWYLADNRKIPAPGRDGFPAFYQRYYQYIDHEVAATDEKLAALDGRKPGDHPVLMGSPTGTVATVDSP
jgi:hypothetical protein